ncbi:MAG: hypothetical protein ACFFAN_14350 [Promethearchaeota archaeon]
MCLVNVNNIGELEEHRKDFKLRSKDVIEERAYRSGSYPLTFIHVDNNWTKTKDNNLWCYGAGIEGNPYVIENVSISGGRAGICILIGNSTEYFIIRNCALSNAEIGIKIVNATNFRIINNTITNLKGQNGNDGINNAPGESGENGNKGIGIAIEDCNNINISLNIISKVSAGNGGLGGNGTDGIISDVDGNNGGIGGNGNKGYGIFIDNSSNILLFCNNISSVAGGNGGDGGDGGKGYNDGIGGIGGNGGVGGLCSGIYSKNSTAITSEWNNIWNITGGNGGNGGDGGSAGDDRNGGDGGNGGAGGLSSAIHFENSTGIENKWNEIWKITNGDGGEAGEGGDGRGVGSDGNDGSTGDNGIHYGFVLEKSNNSLNYYNSIYCRNNNDTGYYNQWNNTNIGNYWSYYSGKDVNPRDGIGDDLHPLNGSAGTADNFPFFYEFDMDYDQDGLNNAEEYTLGADNYITNMTKSDTDMDSFNDGLEFSLGTKPTDALWYPMPNLYVSDLGTSKVYKDKSFILYFTIGNNGIWKAEGILVVVQCEELSLTFYDNTDTPFDLDVDESITIAIEPDLDIGKTGDYLIDLTIDPNTNINEKYSSKDGSLRSDWESDNFKQIEIDVTEKKTVDIDVDEGYTSALITSIVILGIVATVLAVGLTLLYLHIKSMKERIIEDYVY